MKSKAYLILLFLVFTFIPFLAYCAEELTITTYYPSPYGSYRELTSYRMKIGTNYSGSGTTVSNNNLIVEGSVGIGTAGPSELLTLAGNNKIMFTGVSAQNQPSYIYTNSEDSLCIEAGLENGKAINIGSTSYGYVKLDSTGIWLDSGSASLKLHQNGGLAIGSSYYSTNPGADNVIIQGSVGIARTPTTNRLEVEGNASKTAAGDWLANSDIRIKTDVQDIKNPLEVINQLRPVKFRYTKDYMTKHESIEDRYYYNFVAQEFQEVFPDSVKEDGEGYLQIDTYNVKPYLVAAIQELHGMVNELKAENKALFQRIQALEAKLNIGQ